MMFKLIRGDCVEKMRGLASASVDAVITDPPYGLAFMGKEWDTAETPLAFQSWTSEWAKEALRVLKPAGSLLAFGGTRTYHRLTCGIEDAGFKIKDTLAWVYASGFPKAVDVTKLIDKKLGVEKQREEIRVANDGVGNTEGNLHKEEGFASSREKNYSITAPASEQAKPWAGWKVGGLKPAFEPIVWALKPAEGSLTDCVLKYGTGAFNADACRIPYENAGDLEAVKSQDDSFLSSNTPTGNDLTHGKMPAKHFPSTNESGRFPSNLLLTEPALREDYNKFFLIPKAAASEKHEDPFGDEISAGESELPFAEANGSGQRYNKSESPSPSTKKNFHPTVKPVELMKHLIKLVTRENALVLDPFVGSGSTLLACRELRRSCVGIEQNAEYCEIVKARFGKTLGESLEVIE